MHSPAVGQAYSPWGVDIQISKNLGEIWWSLLVRGLLAAMLGLAALLWPAVTLALLIRLIGLYVLFDGIISLVGSVRSRLRGAYFAPGLISVVIGLILLFWPDVTGRLLMVIIGLWALFHGVLLLLASRYFDLVDPDRVLVFTIGTAAVIFGLVLVIWPSTGVIAISWTIAIAALLIGALLISLSLRLRRSE